MRKYAFLLFAAALCLCAAPDFASAARPAVPDKPLDIVGSKKTVVFDHKSHSSNDCAVCHHEVNGAETYEKCATAGCHDDLEGRKSPALYFVIHERKGTKHQTCVSCHLNVVAEKPDLKKELTGCKQSKCHPGD